MMHDWEEMASIVGRNLVAIGQTRILQRIYDGVTSNWTLDTADDKGSMEHLLIHLVWRKFPRNRHPTEDQQPTVSTQTEEASSPTLGLATSAVLTGLLPKTTISDSTQTTEDMRPGPKHISRNYVASVSDCFSQSDLEELFDENVPPSDYDADWTDCSMPSSDSSQDSSIPFKTPARRRSGKPLSQEKKFHLQLSNHFDGLEEVVSKVKSPPKFSYETQSYEIPTTSRSNYNIEYKNRDVGTVTDLMPEVGSLVSDSCPDRSETHLFMVTDRHKKLGLKKGDKVSYIFRPNIDWFDAIDVEWFDNG